MSELLIKLWDSGTIQKGIWETVYMTFVSAFFSYLIGLPLGILLNVTAKDGIHPMPWLYRIVSIFVNIFRSIPFVILMVAMLPVAKLITGTSLGNNAMIVTLAESSFKEVGGGVIEAAKSMGASDMRIICRVLIPEAKPSLIVGSVISLVTILGYSAMAGTIGGGGLGMIAVSFGYQRFNDDIIWICVLLTIIIVQIIQETGMLIARKTDKRIR